MESITPILIVAFNRPTKLKMLIDSLRKIEPRVIRVSFDGPREGNVNDQIRINQCLEYVNEINWTKDIKVYQNQKNLKPRFVIPQAVDTVLEEFKQLIVLEDDVEISYNTLKFLEWCLNKYEKNLQIGHISGYSNVPIDKFQKTEISHRLTIFPESYVWATWRDRWTLYKDFTNDVNLVRLFDINKNYFSNIGKIGRISWRIEKSNADQGYISSWAYRWMFTLWNHQLYCVSPNRNLVRYSGQVDGTHVRTKQRWKELEPYFDHEINIVDSLRFFPKVEKWSSKKIYRDNIIDLVKLIFISIYFRIFRK
jgi:hypothetical protein